MMVDLRKLARPVFLAWGFGVFSVILLFLVVFVLVTSSEERRWLINDRVEFDTEVSHQLMLSASDHKRISIDFANKIISRYGYRYHHKNRKAMHPKARADFVLKSYEYEKLLDLPTFTLLSFAMLESYFNPYESGPYNESGMFQFRKDTVAQADSFWKDIRSPKIREKLRFRTGGTNDLIDPLNQLKMAAVLIWGYRIDFGNDLMWYVSAYHWGGGQMYKYYVKGVLPPDEFVFNRGTIKEDVRNPFSYYFVWSQIHNAFSGYRQQMSLPLEYISAFRKAASERELIFIDHLKLIQNLKNSIRDLKEMKTKFTEGRERELERLEKLVFAAEKDYAIKKKWIKKGNFTTIEQVWTAERAIWKQFLKDLFEDKFILRSRIVIYSTAAVGAVLLLFSLVGVYVFLRWGFRNYRKRRRRLRAIKEIQ